MSVLAMVIIWCDVSFETEKSYQPMRDEFNEAVAASSPKPKDPLNAVIFDEGREDLRSNEVLIITVQTIDDAMKKIKENEDKKVFVICSGTLGRCLVPKVAKEYPYVHDIYVYAHDPALHYDWVVNYAPILMTFNFPVSLLVRLTRDISAHFIAQGEMHLQIDDPQDALKCFNHARNLEMIANVRAKMTPNTKSTEPETPQPDFRRHLDQLEGENGLISKAHAALRELEYPIEDSQN